MPAIVFGAGFKSPAGKPAATVAGLAVGMIPAWMGQIAVGTTRAIGFGLDKLAQ